MRQGDPGRAERLGGLLLQDGADAEEDEPEGADRFREETPRALDHSYPPSSLSQTLPCYSASTVFLSRRFDSSTSNFTAAS